MNMKLFKTFILLLFLTTPLTLLAHPGNTASDGCHYCRTRCDYWGVPWGERHCHLMPPKKRMVIATNNMRLMESTDLSNYSSINHSGRTDSDGCHIDHKTDTYHCH